MLEIVWFDPGITTGYCLLKVKPAYVDGAGDTRWETMKDYVTVEHKQLGRHARGTPKRTQRGITYGYLDTEISIVEDCGIVLDDHPEAAWGYEDFILKGANKSREFLSPVRIFSMLAYDNAGSEYPRSPFVQGTSIKASVDDERLKRAGLYVPGMIHANDAARHAAHFLRRARSDEALAKRAWPNR